MDHIAEMIAGDADTHQQRIAVAMSNLGAQTGFMEVIDEGLEFADSLSEFWPRYNKRSQFQPHRK